MVRLGAVALLALSLPAVASSEPPGTAPNSSRNFQLPGSVTDRFERDDRFGRAQIAPNTHFGFGMFGLKPEKSPLRPVTGRELDAPKQRRAAVGFSLRF